MPYLGLVGKIVKIGIARTSKGDRVYRGTMRFRNPGDKEVEQDFVCRVHVKEQDEVISLQVYTIRKGDSIKSVDLVKPLSGLACSDTRKLMKRLKGHNLYLHSWMWKKFFKRKDSCINPSFIENRYDSEGDYIYLLKSGCVAVPLLSSKNIDYLRGDEIAFPISLYPPKPRPEKSHMRLSNKGVYKHGTQENLPLVYRNVHLIKLSDNDVEKRAQVYLHGFVEPEKWHLDVITHWVDDQTWKRLRSSLRGVCQNAPRSCESKDCKYSGDFESSHSLIGDYCTDYLRHIVTLWESAPTIYAKLEKPRVHRHDMVGKNNIRLIEAWALKEEQSEPATNLLVLRGITYNFAEDNPVFHLNPVTCYVVEKNLDSTIASKVIDRNPTHKMTIEE